MSPNSELLDVAAAETRFAELTQCFPGKVGLAHGRLDPEVREAAIRDFAAGRTTLLVATTVIEVGVDVPEATVMVIEHAERFGLAQLHQLRGRVGRGSAASYCMLLYDEALGLNSRERLLTLRDTEDGFVIADADFRLRGGGEALGTRQSGAPVFRLGLPEADLQDGLITMANRDAALLLEKDPASPAPAARRRGCCCGCSAGRRRWRPCGRVKRRGGFATGHFRVSPSALGLSQGVRLGRADRDRAPHQTLRRLHRRRRRLLHRGPGRGSGLPRARMAPGSPPPCACWPASCRRVPAPPASAAPMWWTSRSPPSAASASCRKVRRPIRR